MADYLQKFQQRLAVLGPHESSAGRDGILQVGGVVSFGAVGGGGRGVCVDLEEVEDGSDVVELRPGAQPPGATDAEPALCGLVHLDYKKFKEDHYNFLSQMLLHHLVIEVLSESY